MHHYIECGLDNVWLESGYRSHRTAYGNAVSFELADALDAAIALELTNKAGRITGKELRFLRIFLAMSQADFGGVVGATEQSVSLWERTGKVPQSADIILRMLTIERIGIQTNVSKLIGVVTTSACRLPLDRVVFKLTRAKWRVDHQVFQSEVTATKESAVAFLKRAGLVTATGRVKQLIRD